MKLKEVLRGLGVGRDTLPIVGIGAFALGSVHSLKQLFSMKAAHDTALFWLLACAVEVATAVIIWKLVATLRIATKSNQSKENRRFFGGLSIALAVLVLPSLGVSIVANFVEFGGNLGLALLCPVMAVACAIIGAVPEAERRFAAMKETERQQAETTRQQRRKEKEAKRRQLEAERKEAEAKAEAERQHLEAKRLRAETETEAERQMAEAQARILAMIPGAAATLAYYKENPKAIQKEAALALGVSERTVRGRLAALEGAGLIRRNGQGVVVLEREEPNDHATDS